MIERYQVGRGTLRESLRFLEMNGVVTLKPGPGGGPFLGIPDSRDLAGTLSLFLQLHSTTLGSILEVRRVIEPAVSALAAANATAATIEALGRSVELMEVNVDDLEQFHEENRRFHELVAWAAGNPIFALLISSLWYITDESSFGVGYPVKRRRAVVRAHRMIYEALASADVEQARLAMERHMSEFGKYVRTKHSAAMQARVRWDVGSW